MPTILSYKGVLPQIHASVFLADGARVIGDVVLGEGCSVWFNAVVRGDVCPVRIGERTNIQDNAVIHVTHDTGPTTIGSDVTIGHAAVLHACTISDHVLVGMNATVLDHARLPPYTMVAAGSLVRQGFEPPEGMLLAGVPTKVKRPLTEEERRVIATSPGNYQRYVAAYRQGGYSGGWDMPDGGRHGTATREG